MRRLFVFAILLMLLGACGKPLATSPQPSAFRPTPTPAAAPAPLPTATLAAAQPTAPPLPSATPAVTRPWRFVVLGDTRTEGLQPPDIMRQIVGHAAGAEPDVVLAVGDLIKAMDDADSVRAQWRNWRQAVEPLGADHVLVTPGNHDVESGEWSQREMAAAFPELPNNGPRGLERLAYSFDYQGVRFISLDSEIVGDGHRFGPAQLDWLDQQLATNPGRFAIVFSHDPAYPVGPHVGSSLDAYPDERDRFWTILRERNVTAYIAGHEHLYNRQQIAGVNQLIIGASGSYPYQGYGGDFFHYAVGEVDGEAITMTIYDADGAQRDQFVLP